MRRRTGQLVVLITAMIIGIVSLMTPQPTSSTLMQQQPYHFGFKKSKNGMPASIDQEGFKSILEANDAIFQGDNSRKALYLTFDNGYENGYTDDILDVLKAKNVPAVFFVTGQYIQDQPELIKRMVREGHTIGNHSWSHPDLTTLSDEQIRNELDRVRMGIQNVTGQQEMIFLRPPRGIFDKRTLQVSRNHGYINVFWSIAYKDWETNRQKGAEYAFRNVSSQLHPGAIILLHSVSKDNAEAMGRIIDHARSQGYAFRRLEELVVPGS
jgi:peptidoglycan-N-acetylmuramic acid deacetylase